VGIAQKKAVGWLLPVDILLAEGRGGAMAERFEKWYGSAQCMLGSGRPGRGGTRIGY